MDIRDPNKDLKALVDNHINVFYEKGSITDKVFVSDIFKRYFDKFGYIDILINAAGIICENSVDTTMQINIVS